MTGLKLIAMAWRNLWRQRRRTILTLVSIAFGFFLAILMTAMQDRSFADFIDTAARLGSGHVTLQHPDYKDKPTLSNTVIGTDAMRAAAEQDGDVVSAVERTVGQTMVSTASDSFGALFIAYDPALESADTMVWTEGLVAGELFVEADDDGILLGKILAENLGAEIGDKIVFTMTDRTGEIVTDMERVRGIVSTGAPSLDAGLVLLPIDTVRNVVGYDPTESTQVAVFLGDGRRSMDAAARLRGELGDQGVSVLTWDEIQPEIRAFIAMKVGGARVFEIVIGLLVAAGIFNTMFMSVMERSREFGIMMAIGYSPRQLFSLVMAESAMLAILGLGLGALVTIGPYTYLSNNGIDMTEMYAAQGGVEIQGVGFDMVLNIGIFPENAVAIAAAVVIATVVAGIWPAWKAGRVNPVEAINLA
ncbi:MAG: ABC transporter permease [Proteobacteria bacterium]|nr:ABC transporter permease [Pseudomonadota bacterium]MCP4922252.1 ABC transporter permease [Pseudomonadota bacterium]